MRDAMGRVVTVNAKRDSTAPNEEFGITSGGQFGIGSVTRPDDYGRDFRIATPSPVGPQSHSADQGPCLYFGPRGQRCSRRALAGGFCPFHQPGGIPSGRSKPSKKFVASVLAIVAVIWPYLADIVREVIRWIHAH
ncbi:MAG TPA: hypothetical protein VN875_17265 [Candidatus Binatus sp.]|jgi:hypothetical protein|nr:hypothetical protein [Candidatus Binatus sp.]